MSRKEHRNEHRPKETTNRIRNRIFHMHGSDACQYRNGVGNRQDVVRVVAGKVIVMEKEWIGKLKVGDLVIVSFGYNSDRIERVERITKSGRIIVGGRTFKPDGWQYGGGSYYYSQIREATEECVNQIHEDDFKKKVLMRMRGTNVISYEQAVEIERILFQEATPCTQD